MVVSGPPQSPRTGLALTDLQQSTSASSVDSNSSNGSNGASGTIGGALISGLAIAGNGSGNWSTRGVGGIGAGLSCSATSSASPVGGGLFGAVKLGGGIGGIGGLHSGGGQIQGPFGFPSSNGGGGGLFNNCGCSSSDYGLFKK